MFTEHFNKQYKLISEGNFANVLIKRPKYKATSTYYGTKEEAIKRNEFKSGSNDFFFLHGRDCPVIKEYLTEEDKEVRLEIKSGPLTKKQWEELKLYMDALYEQ